MKRNSQKPSALCRSQLTRRHPSAALYDEAALPAGDTGHQTTMPVRPRTVATALSSSVPGTAPRQSSRSSSWRRASQRTKNLALRDGVAELLTRLRVEQALLLHAILLDPDFERWIAT